MLRRCFDLGGSRLGRDTGFPEPSADSRALWDCRLVSDIGELGFVIAGDGSVDCGGLCIASD